MNKDIHLYSLGVGLFSIPVITLLLSSCVFFAGLSINVYIFPIAVVVAFFILYLLNRKTLKSFLILSGVLLIILIVSFFISINIFDYSYDGQWYHQEMIFDLAKGWNPVYEHKAPVFMQDTAIWVEHYAKGLETVSACVYKTLGLIEAGKMTVFLTVGSSMLFFYCFLALYFPFLTKIKRIFLTVIFTFSPIVVTQFFTYYIDWSLYSLLLIFISNLLILAKKQLPITYYLIGGVIIFAIAIKFNIFFWICYVLFFFLIYLWKNRKINILKQILIFSSVGVFLGCLAAFNPYITNMQNNHHPFYPLMGDDKVDIMSFNTPNCFQGKSRTETVIISNFSFPTELKEDMPEIPLLSNIKTKHLYAAGGYDTRIGAFGMFFSWLLILATFLFCFTLAYYNPHRKYYIVILFLIFTGLFVLPAGWWARYVSFFYAFPLIMLLYTEYFKSKKINTVRNILYLLVTINILFTTIMTNFKVANNQVVVNNALKVLKASCFIPDIDFVQNLGFKIKLLENSIKFNEVKRDSTYINALAHSVYFNSNQFQLNNMNLLAQLGTTKGEFDDFYKNLKETQKNTKQIDFVEYHSEKLMPNVETYTESAFYPNFKIEKGNTVSIVIYPESMLTKSMNAYIIVLDESKTDNILIHNQIIGKDSILVEKLTENSIVKPIILYRNWNPNEMIPGARIKIFIKK